MAGPDVPEVDVEHADAARIYDYMLGGAHHFAIDREYAAAMLERFPEAARAGHANRAFTHRAVDFCLDLGIDQYLDLGSGIPTAGNVHEVARTRFPHARVAYVDVEPVAVAHSREVVARVDTVSVTRADLRDVATVLGAPGVAGLLDLDRPVAVLAVAALHYVAPDDDLRGILDAYRAVMAPGSALVVSHGSDDVDDPTAGTYMRSLAEVMATSATPAYLRSRTQLHEALAGFDLVEPGLVDIRRWRPKRDPADEPDAAVYGAVGMTRSPDRARDRANA